MTTHTSNSMYPREPSAAAAALPILDLPVGTYLSWMEEQGFGRAGIRRWGVITKVTTMSYMVEATFGDTARISRTIDAFERRGVTVMYAPEELAEIRRALKAQSDEAAAKHEQERRDEEERQRVRKAHQRASATLIERHQQEYDALVAEILG